MVSKLHEMLREKSEEAYFALRLSSPDKQEQLMAIFVVFHEAYEAYTANSEPMVGKIKISWWRERLEEIASGTTARPHPALLALAGSFEEYPALLNILDEFEKMLDGWQPKNFDEIEEFIKNTFGELFKICGKVSGAEGSAELGIYYGNAFLFNKLVRNNNLFQSAFEIDEAKLNFHDRATKMKDSHKNSAFAIIANHHLKAPHNKRWLLLVKIIFSAKTAF